MRVFMQFFLLLGSIHVAVTISDVQVGQGLPRLCTTQMLGVACLLMPGVASVQT